MTEPTQINLSLAQVLDNFAKSIWGRTRSDALHDHICVRCGERAGEFRDVMSTMEYHTSGFCQVCQDRYFEPMD